MTIGVQPNSRAAGADPAGRVVARPGRLTVGWLLAGVAAVLVATVAGLALGPVRLSPLVVPIRAS